MKKPRGWRKGWRVVAVRYSEDGETYHSAFTVGLAEVEYKLGVPVGPRPGCGPLLVCRTYKEAGYWADNDDSRLILPCWYKPSVLRSVWTPYGEARIDWAPFHKVALADQVIIFKHGGKDVVQKEA